MDRWCAEYGIERSMIKESYAWIDKHTMGQTICKSGHCVVIVTSIFQDRPIAARAVAWHEFCHAEKWLRDGSSDGHGLQWLKRLWRKPILFLLDFTYCNIVFAIQNA